MLKSLYVLFAPFLFLAERRVGGFAEHIRGDLPTAGEAEAQRQRTLCKFPKDPHTVARPDTSPRGEAAPSPLPQEPGS